MKKLLTLLIGILFAATLSAQHSNTFTYPFYIGKAGTSTGSITLYGTTSGSEMKTSTIYKWYMIYKKIKKFFKFKKRKS